MKPKQNWTYCVVGNIVKTHVDKDGTLRYGTAAFTGGTKVYLCGRLWRKRHDHIEAMGISRRRELQVITTDIALIENVRCQKTFKPAILAMMDNHEYRHCWWGKSKREKEHAEAFVRWWNKKRPHILKWRRSWMGKALRSLPYPKKYW